MSFACKITLKLRTEEENRQAKDFLRASCLEMGW